MAIKLILLVVFLAIGFKAYCQKLYVSPNLGMQFGALNYYPKANEPASDFTSPRIKIDYSIGIGLYYKDQLVTHRLAYHNTNLGLNFRVSQRPPYAYLGGLSGHSSSINHSIISYSFQREQFRRSKLVGNVSLKAKASLGAGFSPNRSGEFYDSVYSNNQRYVVYQTGDFFGYNYTVNREGVGIFLMPEIGFDLFNKKGKRFLNVEAYYYKGLSNMVTFDINYYYGNLNNNTRIDRHQIARNRGTHFGLKIGVPIRLLKE
jgi:hypothetical protein